MQSSFEESRDFLRIFQFHKTDPNRLKSRESTWLEFKESFNWGDKSKYSKTMTAFANRQGGYIVFGISSSPHRLVGLKNNRFEELDEAKIAEFLNKAFSSEIQFDKFTTVIDEKTIGLLKIYPISEPPIICLNNNDATISEGEIYYRYNARSEKIKYPELKALLDKVRELERASWMSHLEKISRIGAQSVAILNLDNGEVIGNGGSFLIDSKVLPKIKFIKQGSFREGGTPTLRLIGDVQSVPVVGHSSTNIQVTDDPTAPSLRLEEEVLLRQHFPLSYDEMVKQLRKRYTDFKTNKKFQDVHKALKSDKTLYRERFLDIDNAKSSKKGYYSPLVIKQFDKHFTVKKK